MKKLLLSLVLYIPFVHVWAAPEVLMVLTSESTMGDSGKATGFWLSELTHPYQYLSSKGAVMTIASINGGKATIDPGSLDEEDRANTLFLKRHKELLSNTPGISDLAGKHYDAVILVGGHGTMWDFRQSAELAKLVGQQWKQDATVAAVCHGVSGLLDVNINGKPLLNGKIVTGFSNSEEAAIKLTKVVPYSLEDALVAAGADYQQGSDFTSVVKVDGRLITGQNPMSSQAIAEAVWKQIAGQK